MKSLKGGAKGLIGTFTKKPQQHRFTQVDARMHPVAGAAPTKGIISQKAPPEKVGLFLYPNGFHVHIW